MEEVRNNSFKLAKKILESGFKPTILFAITRGGVYVANPISEYFKYVNKHVFYGIVGVSSYDHENKPGEVVVNGWIPQLSSITENDRVILIDDIIDKGKTVEKLIEELEKNTPLKREIGIPISEKQIMVVSHDFKEYLHEETNEKNKPDIFINHWKIDKEELWIHYDSHELMGLTEDEVKERYGV